MSRYAPKQDRGGGQPAARRDRSRHRRGDAHIPLNASGPTPRRYRSSHPTIASTGATQLILIGGIQ